MKITTIEMRHALLRKVGHVLEESGFTLGMVGGGYATMERHGGIEDSESKKLRIAMAEIAFEFDCGFEFDVCTVD